MNIEEKLRGALDVSAPPPTTTLDVVMKRGRRRVFAQRAGSVLGVVAVVAGIGIGATTLNRAAPPTPADRPPDLPSTVVHQPDWSRVNTPAQIPYRTWSPSTSAPPGAGRAVVDLPQCNIRQPSVPRSPGLGAQPLAPELVEKWRDLAAELLPEMTIGKVTGFPTNVFYEFDVSDSRGAGSIQIWAARFTGTPLASADDGLWETGDCEPARRLVQPNGSVLQLHSVRPFEPFQSLTQELAVYRRDGLLVQLRLRNFGSRDFTSGNRTGAGRQTLPLTEEQFSKLGPVIAEVG